MALITYADKSNLGTQPSIPAVNKITDSDMNEIKNVINNMEPTLCVASTNTAPTLSSNYFVLLNLANSLGNLTLQDGGIRIGSGIHHIRVSGNVFVDGWPGGTSYLWTKIYRFRGATETIISGNINGSPSSYLSSPVPSSIIDVQEGDIIKLMADSGSGGTIRGYTANTWLCVEKID